MNDFSSFLSDLIVFSLLTHVDIQNHESLGARTQSLSLTASAMELTQTEMSFTPNGRSHDPGEEALVPVKSLLEEDL